MKTIRLVFSVLSVLIAGVATVVNAQIYIASMYYRAPDGNFNTPGARCGVVVPLPCGGGWNTMRCNLHNAITW